MSNVYEEFAEDVSNSRRALWPGVVKWFNAAAPGSTILDVGCGNGKYLSLRSNDCTIFGCDTSAALVEIAQLNHPKATICLASGLSLPYEDASFDAVVSVAVIHHLPLFEERSKFVDELLRVLKPGGRLLITVWATEAVKPLWIPLGNNDYLVPWKTNASDNGANGANGANSAGESNKFDRFYHLFTRHEAQQLVNGSQVNFERNNWYISFQSSIV